jgi:methyl-accepting chemotaxis protein
MYTTVTPVLTLNNSNNFKNMTMIRLPEEFQNAVLKLKTNLKKQEMKLEELQKYSQRIIDLIDESNKSVEKMGELNNFINKKMNNYESIINQLTENFKFLSESFEQEQKNISLMEQDLGFKIEIPSKYLIDFSLKLYNKTIIFNERLNNLITLIKVYYSQVNGNMDFDGDILESTLAEFIKIIRNLLEQNERQEKMINEMYQMIFEFARKYGEDPETVRNNILQYSLENDNKN